MTASWLRGGSNVHVNKTVTEVNTCIGLRLEVSRRKLTKLAVDSVLGDTDDC